MITEEMEQSTCFTEITINQLVITKLVFFSNQNQFIHDNMLRSTRLSLKITVC